MKTIELMKPFRDQPEPGKAVTVFLKDGSKRKAITCQVESYTGFSGLQWYCVKKRKAINVNEIKGWVPYSSNH